MSHVRAEGEADTPAMTALLTGYTYSALQGLNDVLASPLIWGDVDPEGIITLTLASGLHVTIAITVRSPAGEI